MKLSDLRNHLTRLATISFRLPDGSFVPAHFHVTEVGIVNRHFIDCGGTERRDTVAGFQLWEAGDDGHRLAPEKFLQILHLSRKILGDADPAIEVEYQQGTIGRFGLDFDGTDFLLTPLHTACLALDSCGAPAPKQKRSLASLQPEAAACCTPGGGCC